jgi:plastocyanin
VRWAAAAALLAPVAILLAAPAAAQKPVPRAHVQVVAEEFDFALSRQTIKSGPVTIQLANFGQDSHDLRLRRIAPGAKTLAIGTVSPGSSADLRTKLAPGRYVLWCSIADHRQLGMETQLVVKRR